MHVLTHYLSCEFCMWESKCADQLCSDCTADQRICFRYTNSTIPPLLISEIAGFLSASVPVQAGLCKDWSEIPKTGFLASCSFILVITAR